MNLVAEAKVFAKGKKKVKVCNPTPYDLGFRYGKSLRQRDIVEVLWMKGGCEVVPVRLAGRVMWQPSLDTKSLGTPVYDSGVVRVKP